MAETAHIHQAGGKPMQPMAWELLCCQNWEGRGGRLCEGLTDPFVMRLVNIFVHAGVMFQAMNPVDANIIESHVQD